VGTETYLGQSPTGRTILAGELESEKDMLTKLRKIFGDERGVTALEYALIAALIAVVIIGAVSVLGSSVSKVFSTVANTI
jgi:pilus assembly protein Flp/PilA